MNLFLSVSERKMTTDIGETSAAPTLPDHEARGRIPRNSPPLL
jgi:hypothetical protein